MVASDFGVFRHTVSGEIALVGSAVPGTPTVCQTGRARHEADGSWSAAANNQMQRTGRGFGRSCFGGAGRMAETPRR